MEERRVVVVTGAAGAIGSATARAFVDGGFHVVGLDREPSITGTIDSEHFTGLQVDLADEVRTCEAVAAAAEHGRLVHVVSIAGGALPQEPGTAGDPMAVSATTFRASVDANLTTQFLVLRAALPLLRRNAGEDRSIALTSSFNALTGCGMPAYSAAKAALTGLMYALVDPLGKDGIRINVIAPGSVRTPRTERIWQHDPTHFPRLEAGTALGRLGSPDDIARAFIALSTLLSHVTGQVLVVDGGQMVKRN
jgi:meso-butanediol dehydrogenase / (S,S)-butanediol dehydrogenase / diacetyl reductase